MTEDTDLILYIMLGRIYDVLMIIADEMGRGQDVLELRQLHESGELICPPPSLKPSPDPNAN